MNATVLWDIVPQAKIEGHEGVARVALLSNARGAISIGHERSLSNRLRTWSHPRRNHILCRFYL